MPKKDGREVLKELKQHPVFKKIPVIVFTTTKNEIEIKRCYELGANSYVVKPITFDALLKVVENIRSYWFQTASIPVSEAFYLLFQTIFLFYVILFQVHQPGAIHSS